MTQQIIEVTITPQGMTKVETKGFQGTSCRDASRLLEIALGQPIGEQLTSEFHQTATLNQSARHRQ